MPDVVVSFSYRDKQGVGSLRRVRATSMAWSNDPRYGGKLCLRAFDLDRDDWRSFLFDRMGAAVQIIAPEVPNSQTDAYTPGEEGPPF